MAMRDVDVAMVLAKSARHCCICRQFLPLQIQVHHIEEKKSGGVDHIDNLIPICITCHAAVHTQAKMTKNFSSIELRMHRDAVYEMVAMGKLPASKPLSHNEVAAIASSILGAAGDAAKSKVDLPKDATEILLIAAAEDAPIIMENMFRLEHGGERTIVDDEVVINIGNQVLITGVEPDAKYPATILRLIEDGLLGMRDDHPCVTPKGFAHVEKLVSTVSTFTTKKIECRSCGLHFIICTSYADRHNRRNLTCPECGQNSGQFMIWTQKQLGFIFELVPGRAVRVE